MRKKNEERVWAGGRRRGEGGREAEREKTQREEEGVEVARHTADTDLLRRNLRGRGGAKRGAGGG